MHPFSKHKCCHICTTKFAIFRRACHCRNCGVCVCKDCVVQWPSKMIPETYNTKKENSVHACKSCDWVCNSFRLALLEGNHDKAVALHASGNVNLHTPFANVKGELFYPVHCAVLGGNLDLLKFLVDGNCCPIKYVRETSGKNFATKKFTPIVTSKGRSLLGIAMENENLQISHYLVVEKGATLAGAKDVLPEMLRRNFEKLLHFLPEDFFTGSTAPNDAIYSRDHSETEESVLPVMGGDFDGVEPLTPAASASLGNQTERSLNEEAHDFGAVKAHKTSHRPQSDQECDESVIEECKSLMRCVISAVKPKKTLLLELSLWCMPFFCPKYVSFAGIICFDHSIDCVATPCGHQICCLACSEHLSSRCPVCSAVCSFMRIYKTT